MECAQWGYKFHNTPTNKDCWENQALQFRPLDLEPNVYINSAQVGQYRASKYIQVYSGLWFKPSCKISMLLVYIYDQNSNNTNKQAIKH